MSFQRDRSDTLALDWARQILNADSSACTFEHKAIALTPWSSVYAINTQGALYYLKKTPHTFLQEADIILLLKKETRASLPHIIAKNRDLNCFLMADAGRPLHEILNKKNNESLIRKTVAQFARLQHESIACIDLLFKLGVPDYRLNKIPALYHQMLEERGFLAYFDVSQSDIQQLETMRNTVHKDCDTLSKYHINETLVQPDFNTKNTLFNESTKK